MRAPRTPLRPTSGPHRQHRIPEFAAGLPQTQAALAYAERLHEGQLRGVDGAPFIVHPIEVGMLLYESGAGDEVIAAGVLHDTLEKTDATAYDIYARFGRRVGDIVCAVSHDPAIPGYARRKAALRDQTASAGDDALAVFAADKLSKVRELGLGDGSGIKVRSRKLRHYRLSLAMLRQRLPDSPLVAALATELDGLALTQTRHAGGAEPTARWRQDRCCIVATSSSESTDLSGASAGQRETALKSIKRPV